MGGLAYVCERVEVIEENEAVRMSYCELRLRWWVDWWTCKYVGGWVGGWFTSPDIIAA